jgi:hypothetical protein
VSINSVCLATEQKVTGYRTALGREDALDIPKHLTTVKRFCPKRRTRPYTKMKNRTGEAWIAAADSTLPFVDNSQTQRASEEKAAVNFIQQLKKANDRRRDLNT